MMSCIGEEGRGGADDMYKWVVMYRAGGGVD
jgi:hypothetical protein